MNLCWHKLLYGTQFSFGWLQKYYDETEENEEWLKKKEGVLLQVQNATKTLRKI